MTLFARRARFALLLLIVLALPAVAQEETVSVAGSAVAGEAFMAATGADSFETDFAGTQNGVSQFCSGAVDIAVTSRPLSVGEASSCRANGVEFSEQMIGFDGYAIIASPDVDFAECISTANLDAIIAPSLTGTDVNWTTVNAAYPSTSIEFVYPGLNSRAAALLDRTVRGEGFRTDATTAADSAAVIADVAAGEGKLGLVSLADAVTAEGVTVLSLNNATLNSCVAPSAETAYSRQYQGGDRLFAYINVNSFEKPGVAEALTALTDASSADALTAAGFVPLTDSLREQAATAADERTAGRVFSRDVETYQITGDTTGTLRAGGDAAGSGYLRAALPTVAQRYGNITLEESYLGGVEAVREFCNGNRELIALSRDFTDEELASCDANSITAHEIALGAQAAVLIANEDSEFLSCVSTGLLADVFAAGGDLPAAWSDYDAELTDEAIYLFVEGKGAALVDLMMAAATGASAPVRDDVQENADAAYRAAAVANTPGAVALLSWAETQDALEDQTGIQLVSVQAEGGDCVEPTAETIADGTYPLSRPVRLVVNQRALESDMLKAALYALFADENYNQIESAGLTGITFSDLVDVRAELVTAFEAAEAAQAEREASEVAPEATAEPTGDDAEPTEDASEGEADVEPTDEAAEDSDEAEATPES